MRMKRLMWIVKTIEAGYFPTCTLGVSLQPLRITGKGEGSLERNPFDAERPFCNGCQSTVGSSKTRQKRYVQCGTSGISAKLARSVALIRLLKGCSTPVASTMKAPVYLHKRKQDAVAVLPQSLSSNTTLGCTTTKKTPTHTHTQKQKLNMPFDPGSPRAASITIGHWPNLMAYPQTMPIKDRKCNTQ